MSIKSEEIRRMVVFSKKDAFAHYCQCVHSFGGEHPKTHIAYGEWFALTQLEARIDIKIKSRERNEAAEKRYITFEEPLFGHIFTLKQLREVYRDIADRAEYPDFDCWFMDMLRTGTFLELKK